VGAKRPLKWLIGLNEEDPIGVQGKVSALLQEGPAVLDEIVRHGTEGLALLLEKDAAEPVDKSVVTLGARLFHQARAVNLLLQNGYIGPSVLLVREMVHTLVLALFLRSYPERADSWHRADTKKERLEFSFGKIREHVEHGEAWKEVYDYYSTMAHSNSEAKVTYAQSRQVFGYDLHLQGFYDPVPTTMLFAQTLRITLWFQRYFYDWYSQELSISVDFESNLDTLDAATKQFLKDLNDRADREDTTEVHDDSLPIYEQVKAIALLHLMIEQKRRGSISL